MNNLKTVKNKFKFKLKKGSFSMKDIEKIQKQNHKEIDEMEKNPACENFCNKKYPKIHTKYMQNTTKRIIKEMKKHFDDLGKKMETKEEKEKAKNDYLTFKHNLTKNMNNTFKTKKYKEDMHYSCRNRFCNPKCNITMKRDILKFEKNKHTNGFYKNYNVDKMKKKGMLSNCKYFEVPQLDKLYEK